MLHRSFPSATLNLEALPRATVAKLFGMLTLFLSANYFFKILLKMEVKMTLFREVKKWELLYNS